MAELTCEPCPKPDCDGERRMGEYACDQFAIVCDCGWEGPPGNTRAKAIQAWNTRSTDERVVELRATLQRTVDNFVALKETGGSGVCAFETVLHYVDELFPACKPSEEEVK